MLRMDSELTDTLLHSIPALLVTDNEGRIQYISENYASYLETSQEDLTGKLVQDVIPGSRMLTIAQTGRVETGLFRLKHGEIVMCVWLPIRNKADQIIGSACITPLIRMSEPSTASTVEQVRFLTEQMNVYKNELTRIRGARYSLEQIIGTSPGIVKMKDLMTKVSHTKSTVLVTGETGTGKELVAHAIHQLSQRSHQPFVRVNCAAIPHDLLESELFGYEEGAFTGAKKGGKPGKFEVANHGTLLLDEINQMPLFLQSKLLRVIQEKELERVGGIRPIEVDVRLIFNTNQDLAEQVDKQEFREDLFYRINVFTIDVPPLKARIQDIPLLAEHFISKINKDLSLNITGVDQDVIEMFQSYSWPGNIRELENIMERGANLALRGQLKMEHFENLLLRINNGTENSENSLGLASTRAKAEREQIIQVLLQTNGNITMAAKILNIHRSVLYNKLKKYGIKE